MASRKAAAAPVAPLAAVEPVAPTSISPELTIYAQLLACAQLGDPSFAVFTDKETPEAFTQRLMTAISVIDEKYWDMLDHDGDNDGEAQAWYNKAADCMREKKPIDALPGMPEFAAAEAPAKPKAANKLMELNAKRAAEAKLKREAAAAGKPVPEASAAEKAAAAPRKPVGRPAKTEAEKAAEKASKPAGERKQREHNPDGLVSQLRRLVLLNPKITVAEMLKEATEKKILARDGSAVKTSTAATIRTDTLAAYNGMKELGLLK